MVWCRSWITREKFLDLKETQFVRFNHKHKSMMIWIIAHKHIPWECIFVDVFKVFYYSNSVERYSMKRVMEQKEMQSIFWSETGDAFIDFSPTHFKHNVSGYISRTTLSSSRKEGRMMIICCLNSSERFDITLLSLWKYRESNIISRNVFCWNFPLVLLELELELELKWEESSAKSLVINKPKACCWITNESFEKFLGMNNTSTDSSSIKR